MFSGVELRFRTLTRDYIQILCDEGDDLDQICARITKQPLGQRRRNAKDLGELMVILHAVAAAERGDDVTVLIDDGDGARQAELERRRLERMRQSDPNLGSITLLNTVGVLAGMAGTDLIPTRAAMGTVYKKLSFYDDGLPSEIKRTGLLALPVW